MIKKKVLQKEAINMLLGGATLASDPCPYCHGVRVIKKGYALCIQCGQKPTNQYNKHQISSKDQNTQTKIYENKSIKLILNKKLEELFNALELETDYDMQYKILRIVDMVISVLTKFK